MGIGKPNKIILVSVTVASLSFISFKVGFDFRINKSMTYNNPVNINDKAIANLTINTFIFSKMEHL